jgi:hypothetical protein
MVKELTVSNIKNYDNRKFLAEAFSEFENASLVTCNDETLIMLDEENEVLYEAKYTINFEDEKVTFSEITPAIIKEEISGFGS